MFLLWRLVCIWQDSPLTIIIPSSHTFDKTTSDDNKVIKEGDTQWSFNTQIVSWWCTLLLCVQGVWPEFHFSTIALTGYLQCTPLTEGSRESPWFRLSPSSDPTAGEFTTSPLTSSKIFLFCFPSQVIARWCALRNVHKLLPMVLSQNSKQSVSISLEVTLFSCSRLWRF